MDKQTHCLLNSALNACLYIFCGDEMGKKNKNEQLHNVKYATYFSKSALEKLDLFVSNFLVQPESDENPINVLKAYEEKQME